MLINSPKNIALFNAFLLALISGVILILISYYWVRIDIPIILVIIAVIFISSFSLINFSISKFFHEKIDIIYKTIGEPQTRMGDEKKKKNSNDVLDLVNQVVLRWSEEKKQEINELKQMASYRREFLGNVSHELKTPVFNIQGYVDTLLEGGLEDETINVKFLQKTQKSVNRMIALVEDLEEISKLESVNLELNIEPFNLYDLATEVIDFMEQKAILNKTKIIINPTASKSVKVLADIQRIRQVLINLIDNAIKYGNINDPVITISFYNFHNNYLIEIQDNGIGIPEENIVRVFERFYRTEESRSRDKGGTGLGLAIVKHIIEAHRQTISVRSNLGEGTTFSFTLKMV
ncbi:MAG: GHKL domain-containing protein [Lentimicrobiaceae bacterium]|jgi:two-component system phosphate regulon sensor histidine kinase PhoR|nr:GHKL domain-containing protein [Lentimicrobiaceae bacterium]MCP4911050.1 GHKL domain-containing protein [Bacteroidota bacterium]MBT3454014.1 GHKL domain-containing protein [Lentimicrobiaceae bacterium]MBT3819132.1 GHKL domain-containing protein [Lentimicrobiaceae bacterium]MBT4060560.1 GHKL domain-containing protein [Lentimicrobiaceae bacterium]